MMADPKPDQSLGTFLGQRPVMQTNPCRVKNASLLESHGGVPGIGLEKFKILVGEGANPCGQLAVTNPEVLIGEVLHSGVQRPASK